MYTEQRLAEIAELDALCVLYSGYARRAHRLTESSSMAVRGRGLAMRLSFERTADEFFQAAEVERLALTL